MENCGDDFLGALADATNNNDDWDDLNAIENEACGNLNGMMKHGVIDDKEVEVRTPLFRQAESSARQTRIYLDSFGFSSDDDFETLESHCDRSVSTQKKV